MRLVRIAALVEGDGEVFAVPALIRRIVQNIDPTVDLVIPRAFRHSSGSILRTGGLERAIDAVAELYPAHSVLVLIDSDDSCPKDLGSELKARVSKSRPDLAVSVVLAHREYEAWFLAAAESLAGRRNLPPDLAPPANPEEVRDAKGWLSRQMTAASRYSPTQDQAALTSIFDLQLALSRSRSFRKLWKEIERVMHLPRMRSEE